MSPLPVTANQQLHCESSPDPFLPAVVLQLLLCLWLQRLEGPAAAGYAFHLWLLVALGVAPAVGLWVAPRVRLFPLAVVATLGLTLGPPLLLAMVSACCEAMGLRESWRAWCRVAMDFRFGRHHHAVRLRRG